MVKNRGPGQALLGVCVAGNKMRGDDVLAQRFSQAGMREGEQTGFSGLRGGKQGF